MLSFMRQTVLVIANGASADVKTTQLLIVHLHDINFFNQFTFYKIIHSID